MTHDPLLPVWCHLDYVTCGLLSEPVIDHNNFIFRLKEPLKEMLDPDFLLPSELMNKKVLTDCERQRVKSRCTLHERNDALLNFVIQKDTAAQLRFIFALRDTDQEHVCNFIKCNGGKHSALACYVTTFFKLINYCRQDIQTDRQTDRHTDRQTAS